MTGPSFRFRLERVRALRERREELAKEQLARALARAARSRQHLQDLESSLEQARADARDRLEQEEAIPCESLRAQQAFLERAEDQRRLGAGELAETETDIARRGEELGRAAREREPLERLKERQRAEHERELLRREGIALDALAIERFRRRAA